MDGSFRFPLSFTGDITQETCLISTFIKLALYQYSFYWRLKYSSSQCIHKFPSRRRYSFKEHSPTQANLGSLEDNKREDLDNAGPTSH